MDDENLHAATERLFDALKDINHVSGSRERAQERGVQEVERKIRDEDVTLEDIWEPRDAPQLRMALKHIDAARDLIEAEIEQTESDVLGDRD